MINIEYTEVFGWMAAIRGMRNPMNSWDKMDSRFVYDEDDLDKFEMGPNDHDLAMKLVKAGNDHGKFLRMIHVQMDVTAPLYWWKEYDTYKVATTANSCSTMHKIHEKPFKREMFSCEHLFDEGDQSFKVPGNGCIECWFAMDVLNLVILALNSYREKYLVEKDPEMKKAYWHQMIKLLPTSYNQRRTCDLNYQVLRDIYHARKNHKLTEWHAFCNWIEDLPYSELITTPDADTYFFKFKLMRKSDYPALKDDRLTIYISNDGNNWDEKFIYGDMAVSVAKFLYQQLKLLPWESHPIGKTVYDALRRIEG